MQASPRRFAFALLEILVSIAILAVPLGILLPAIQQARSASDRTKCANNLRQIGISLNNYHVARQSLPPSVKPRPDPLGYLSWRVRILPYMEAASVWEETVLAFQKQQFFSRNPPHKNLGRIETVFICPAEPRVAGTTPEGKHISVSPYLGVSGSTGGANGLFFRDSAVRFADITDGTSQTLMVGERPPSPDFRYGWWYGGIGQNWEGSLDSHLAAREMNVSIYAPTCPKGPYFFSPGHAKNQCDMFHFWSQHSGGAYFLFADGSVHFLRYTAEPLMVALSTRAGGESAALPD